MSLSIPKRLLLMPPAKNPALIVFPIPEPLKYSLKRLRILSRWFIRLGLRLAVAILGVQAMHEHILDLYNSINKDI